MSDIHACIDTNYTMFRYLRIYWNYSIPCKFVQKKNTEALWSLMSLHFLGHLRNHILYSQQYLHTIRFGSNTCTSGTRQDHSISVNFYTSGAAQSWKLANFVMHLPQPWVASLIKYRSVFPLKVVSLIYKRSKSP